MTEDEAKTKWCPFARVEGPWNGGSPTINRGVHDAEYDEEDNRLPERPGSRLPPQSLCIASACMAWRTRSIRTHVNHIHRDGTAAVAKQPEDIVTADGFCGLAGAPQ